MKPKLDRDKIEKALLKFGKSARASAQLAAFLSSQDLLLEESRSLATKKRSTMKNISEVVTNKKEEEKNEVY